jgi:hypothetical protein
MTDFETLALAIVAVSFIGFALIRWVLLPYRRLRRAEFIRTYKFPRGLLTKLEQHHPGFTRKESALVSRGLRQFFVAYLMSGKEFMAMPSVAADALWHEFILYTREYKDFCRRAFGGFLHHAPAVVLSGGDNMNGGLEQVWWYTCKYENIDPVFPTRLPLLFALDEKLNLPGGAVYPEGSIELDALRSSARTRNDRDRTRRSVGSGGLTWGDTSGSGWTGDGGGDAGGGGGGGCGGGGGN